MSSVSSDAADVLRKRGVRKKPISCKNSGVLEVRESTSASSNNHDAVDDAKVHRTSCLLPPTHAENTRDGHGKLFLAKSILLENPKLPPERTLGAVQAEAQSKLVQHAPRDSLCVFCDLDGVLADFEVGLQLASGKTPAELGKNGMWMVVKREPEFFLNLPWTVGGQQLWAVLSKLHPSPVILTGLPSGILNERAVVQKRQWCANHLGDNVKVICCMSRDKPSYLTPGDVLIDDSLQAQVAWEAKGGIFIHYDGNVDGVCAKLSLACLRSSDPQRGASRHTYQRVIPHLLGARHEGDQGNSPNVIGSACIREHSSQPLREDPSTGNSGLSAPHAGVKRTNMTVIPCPPGGNHSKSAGHGQRLHGRARTLHRSSQPLADSFGPSPEDIPLTKFG